MATSGSTYTSFGTNNGYRFVLEWKRNSIDIAKNKSNVTVTLYLQSTGSSYTINSSVTKNGSIVIDGAAYSFTFGASLNGSQKKQIYTKTIDIYHNSNGAKSFSMSAAISIGISFSSGYVSEVDISSYSATLDTIPRGSSFTLSTTNATLGSTAVTVNITRASSSFTHKVWVHFGSYKATISSNAATSATWTPGVGLASYMPNATNGVATVWVETYDGSTMIGQTSKTMTYTVPSSVVPTFTSLTASVVASGASTSFGYVKGKSKCQLVINGASGSYGSTIKSYKITGNGGTWTTQSATTGVLNSAGTFTYTATVTDSRGRTSTVKNVSITVQDYSEPKITSFTAYRCDADGNALDSGTYIKCSYNASISSLNNNNTKYYNVTTKYNGTQTSTVDITEGYTANSYKILGGYDTAKNYTIIFTVKDAFSSATRIVTISPEFVTIDFKAGGKGIAIGKASASDKFEVEMETQLNNRLCFKKGKWVHQANAGGGTNGYLKFCSIQIKGTYMNQPIRMTIAQRGQIEIATLNICFNNTNSVSPGVYKFTSTGQINAYLHNSSSGVYDLYVLKMESRDTIEVLDVDLGEYNKAICELIWLNEFVATLPSGTSASTGLITTNPYNGEGKIGFFNTDGKGVYYYGQSTGKCGVFDTVNDRGVWGYYVENGIGYFRPQQHTLPGANGSLDLGSASWRWRTVCSVNALNTSDISYKENIIPINEYNIQTLSLDNENTINNDEITLIDMRDFIKDECNLYKYNYKEQDHEEFGFIAQDIVNTKVGRKLILGEENINGGYNYSIGSYIGIVVGALKEEINIRDMQIDVLYETIDTLEQRIAKLEQSINNNNNIE